MQDHILYEQPLMDKDFEEGQWWRTWKWLQTLLGIYFCAFCLKLKHAVRLIDCQAHFPNPLMVYTIDIHIWLYIWSSRSGVWATLWVDPDEKAAKSWTLQRDRAVPLWENLAGVTGLDTQRNPSMSVFYYVTALYHTFFFWESLDFILSNSTEC